MIKILIILTPFMDVLNADFMVRLTQSVTFCLVGTAGKHVNFSSVCRACSPPLRHATETTLRTRANHAHGRDGGREGGVFLNMFHFHFPLNNVYGNVQ